MIRIAMFVMLAAGLIGPPSLLPLWTVSHASTVSIDGRQETAAAGAPQFEVATIRINRSGDSRSRHIAVPATGQMTITNISVSELIQNVYDIQLPSQIVNMPEWARSQRVDIVAKAGGPAAVAVLQKMLQPLLAEYFRLAVRRETREMDALALAVASGGRLGPQLRKAGDGCDDAVGTSNAFARAPESDQRGACGILPGGAGKIAARGLDIAGLADLLAPSQRRPVLDRTGLAGRFDIDLTYTPDAFRGVGAARRRNPAPRRRSVRTTAGHRVAGALGLKLESVRAPVDVLVIERVEPLSADAAGAPR